MLGSRSLKAFRFGFFLGPDFETISSAAIGVTEDLSRFSEALTASCRQWKEDLDSRL